MRFRRRPLEPRLWKIYVEGKEWRIGALTRFRASELPTAVRRISSETDASAIAFIKLEAPSADTR